MLARAYEGRGRSHAALSTLTRLVGEYPDELPALEPRLDALRLEVERLDALGALGYVGY